MLTRLIRQGCRLQLRHVFANGDKLHLRSNDALTGIVKLGHIAARSGPERLPDMLEFEFGAAQVLLSCLGIG